MKILLKSLFIIIISSSLLTGCSLFHPSKGAHIERISQLSDDIQSKQDEKLEYARGMIYSATTLLSETEPDIPLVKQFVTQAHWILGLPTASELTSWQVILDTFIKDHNFDKGQELLTAKFDKVIKLDGEIDELEARRVVENRYLEALHAENAAKAKQWDDLQRSNWLKRFWRWLTGSLGLIGAVVFIVLCPTLAIPFFTALIRGLIYIIPSIASLFGLVGKKVLDNVSRGVGKTRNTLKEIEDHNPDKTFTAKEVREMLDDNLRSTTDGGDKKYIDHTRKKLNI